MMKSESDWHYDKQKSLREKIMSNKQLNKTEYHHTEEACEQIKKVRIITMIMDHHYDYHVTDSRKKTFYVWFHVYG